MASGKHIRRWMKPFLPLVVGLSTYFLLTSGMQSCRGPRPDPYLEAAEWDDAAVEKLAAAKTDRDRYYALGDAANVALKRKQPEKARKLAVELLVMKDRLSPRCWNYGNAIHDAHIVLGYLAIKDGDVAAAKRRLLEAGRTPGSPQLNSFGPNMSLAKRLIEHGEREAVLAYFELCRVFWSGEGARLDEWARIVRSGDTPDFGVSLIH